MVVAVGSGRTRIVEPVADRRDCERRRSFHSFGGRFNPLNRETLQSGLGLIDCKAGGLIACSKLSLLVCRCVLKVGAILMGDLTGKWREKVGARFEEHYL